MGQHGEEGVKDSYWFRHDSNATSDPKIMTLLRAHGWAGYGMFWRVVELMRDTEGYKLERSRIQDAAYAIRADELPQVIETCCSIGLFVCDDVHIWSTRLCRDMEGRDAQREAGRVAIQRRWEAHRKLIGTYKQANTMTGQDITGQDKIGEDSSADERKQLLPGGGPRGRDSHAPPSAAPAGPQRPAGQPDVDQIAEIASQPLEPSVIDFSGLPPQLRAATERARLKVDADAKEKAENLTHKTADYHALKAPQNGKPDRDAEWEAVADAKAKLPYSARGAPKERDAPTAPPGDDFEDPPDDIHEDDT